MHTSRYDTRRSYFLMLAASLGVILLSFLGTLTWVTGVVLLSWLAIVLWDQLRGARAHVAQAQEEEISDLEGADPNMPWWQIGGFLFLGLVGLPCGAELLVENASAIARDFGVSDAVIGLTLVAIGTSLPELATTVMAALRQQADVALGNVIGSNIFNLLCVLGVTTLFGPIPVDPEFLRFDLWVMLAAAISLAPFVLLKRDLGRRWGALLTSLYVAYIVVVLV